MAVASPFLAASLLMMRSKKLGSLLGVLLSGMCFSMGNEQMSLLMVLMPEIIGDLHDWGPLPLPTNEGAEPKSDGARLVGRDWPLGPGSEPDQVLTQASN